MSDSKLLLLLLLASAACIAGIVLLVIRIFGGSDIFSLVSTALSLTGIVLYAVWLWFFRRAREPVPPVTFEKAHEDAIFVRSLLSVRRPGGCERCGEKHRDLRDAIQWHIKRMHWLAEQPYKIEIWGVATPVWYRREKDFVESLEMIKDSQILVNHADR